MVLRMAQPIKRGRFYWLRKKVPDDLREIVGKREEKFSLKTRDPAEAKVMFAKALAEIEERWSRLRQGRISLSHKQAYAIAGEIYRERVSRFENEPMDAIPFDLTLEGEVKPGSIKVMYVGADKEKTKELHQKLVEQAKNPKEIDDYLARRGILLDVESREKVRKAVVEAKHNANLQLQQFAKGNYLVDPINGHRGRGAGQSRFLVRASNPSRLCLARGHN
jgi:hypothetical protein